MPSSLSRIQFAELAATAVAAVGVESANGRVHVVPGERMLRYYTTQEIMDRPQLAVTANGKEARYGRRHLLQFVAAKRLQAGGASLPEIRQRLAQLTDAELAELAAIPPGVIPPGLVNVDASTPSGPPPPFWRQGPAVAASAALAPTDAQRPVPVLVPLSVPGGARPVRRDRAKAPNDAPAGTSPFAPPSPAEQVLDAVVVAPGVRRSSVVVAGATFSPAVAAVPGRTVTVITLGPGIEVHIDNAMYPPAQAALLAAALADAVPTTLPTSREEP